MLPRNLAVVVLCCVCCSAVCVVVLECCTVVVLLSWSVGLHKQTSNGSHGICCVCCSVLLCCCVGVQKQTSMDLMALLGVGGDCCSVDGWQDPSTRHERQHEDEQRKKQANYFNFSGLSLSLSATGAVN